jgi:hypothetical protein
MTRKLRPLAPALLALALAVPVVAPASAQTFSTDQRGEIEKIIREYLLAHPELLQEVLGELDKRQAAADRKASRGGAGKCALIYSSPRHVTLGNRRAT